jgi:hypothetical protein
VLDEDRQHATRDGIADREHATPLRCRKRNRDPNDRFARDRARSTPGDTHVARLGLADVGALDGDIGTDDSRVVGDAVEQAARVIDEKRGGATKSGLERAEVFREPSSPGEESLSDHLLARRLLRHVRRDEVRGVVARSCSRVRIPSFDWARENSTPPATRPSTTTSASATSPRRTRGVCARARIVGLTGKASG